MQGFPSNLALKSFALCMFPQKYTLLNLAGPFQVTHAMKLQPWMFKWCSFVSRHSQVILRMFTRHRNLMTKDAMLWCGKTIINHRLVYNSKNLDVASGTQARYQMFLQYEKLDVTC